MTKKKRIVAASVRTGIRSAPVRKRKTRGAGAVGTPRKRRGKVPVKVLVKWPSPGNADALFGVLPALRGADHMKEARKLRDEWER